MTAREFYEQIGRQQDRVAKKMDDLAVLESIVNKTTTSYSAIPGSHDPQRREKALAEKADLERELLKEMWDLKETQKEVEATIEKLEDDKQKVVIERRYIYGDAWQDIADSLSITIRHAYRIRNNALTATTNILKS